MTMLRSIINPAVTGCHLSVVDRAQISGCTVPDDVSPARAARFPPSELSDSHRRPNPCAGAFQGLFTVITDTARSCQHRDSSRVLRKLRASPPPSVMTLPSSLAESENSCLSRSRNDSVTRFFPMRRGLAETRPWQALF